MEENKKNVHDFHDSLKAFTDWLNTTEVSMRAFVYPSKLVDRILKQIEEHNVSAYSGWYTVWCAGQNTR